MGKVNFFSIFRPDKLVIKKRAYKLTVLAGIFWIMDSVNNTRKDMWILAMCE